MSKRLENQLNRNMGTGIPGRGNRQTEALGGSVPGSFEETVWR